MDELTLLRSTRDDTLEPSSNALTTGRAALLGRIAGAIATTAQPTPVQAKRRLLPRLTWAAIGTTAAMTGVLVAGTVTTGAQSAYAGEVLRTAAAQTIHYAELTPGFDQYLLASTLERGLGCNEDGCEANIQTIDVYMPADPDAEWVLHRDWGNWTAPTGSGSIENLRAVDGEFYGTDTAWLRVDLNEIPVDGSAAYQWIDGQYAGGSMSRDEDNYGRIVEILRTGLVPAPQRAALLDALSRVPGVTATDNVANLDGVVGVAVGRIEPLRFGERQEIIIDPHTGLIIGERVTTGTTVFGVGTGEEIRFTAIETTVVDIAP